MKTMTRAFSLSVSVLMLLATLLAASAQAVGERKATDYRQSYLANPLYTQMARQALTEKPLHFDFMDFRGVYARTRQYDPIGKDVLKTLNDLAYLVMSEADSERAETALFGYQNVVADHLAHIDVVMQALLLARQDSRFGKPEFFEWMIEGLIRTVIISGDGYTLDGAYDVITLSEETILFNRLQFKQEKSQSAKEGMIYYNMHDVIDLKTGQKHAVFVNTSIPMRYLDALKQEADKNYTLDISRQ